MFQTISKPFDVRWDKKIYFPRIFGRGKFILNVCIHDAVAQWIFFAVFTEIDDEEKFVTNTYHWNIFIG